MCNNGINKQSLPFRFFVMKTLLTIFFLILFSTTSLTQDNSIKSTEVPNLQVGFSAGSSLFFGDIKQNSFLPVSENMNEWRFAGGLSINYNISYVFNIRFQGLYGRLSGTKRDENVWFENDYYEVNINTAINFNNLFGSTNYDRLVNIYGVIGFGITNYNTIVKRLNEYYVLKRVGYGYGTGFDGRVRQTFYMIGLGLDFRVSRRFGIQFETVNKVTNSDLIDGVESGKYNDLINYTSIGLTYRFAFLKKSKAEVKEKKTPVVLPVYEPVELHTIKALSISYALKPVLDSAILKPAIDIPFYMPVVVEHVEVGSTELAIEDVKVFENVENAGYDEEIEYVEKAVPNEPNSKIEYRIQIRAKYQKKLPLNYISSKYNVSVSEIMEDEVNGWFVYTTGSFSNYNQAKRMCDELKTGPGLEGAFVVAFKEGARIFPTEEIETGESLSRIKYRIQIQAEYLKPLPLNYLSSKFNIPVSEILEDKENGWYIYTTGSFSEYNQARRMCDELKTGPGLEGAFVVAFKDGIRIYPTGN